MIHWKVDGVGGRRGGGGWESKGLSDVKREEKMKESLMDEQEMSHTEKETYRGETDWVMEKRGVVGIAVPADDGFAYALVSR